MREEPQALFNTDGVFPVDRELIETVKRRAESSPTRRYRLCLHRSAEDPVQQMFIAFCRDSYVRPLSHPDASMSYLVLEGEMTVYVFDDTGQVVRSIDLATGNADAALSLYLAPGTRYMPRFRSDIVLVCETMTGSYRKDEVNIHPNWAPGERDAEGIAALFARLDAS